MKTKFKIIALLMVITMFTLSVIVTKKLPKTISYGLVSVSAAGLEESTTEIKKDENAELKAEIQRRAEVLKEVGLFIGTDKGFELDREPNRTEGLIMLIRLLGEETEALKAEINHPFTDVPKWADAYISYAYQKGYTKGMSNTIFGSDLKITAKQYVTFILRALRYNESDGDFEYNYAMYAAENIALIKDVSLYENRVFTRGDLAYLSYGALQLHVNDKDYIDYYGYPYSLGFYFLLQFYDNSHDEFLRMGEIMVNDGLTPDIHLKERYYTPDIRPDQNRINTNNILKTKLVYKNKIVYSEGEYYSAEFEISGKKIVGKIKDNVGNKTYKVSLMYKDTDRTYIELLNEYSDTKSNNNGTMLFNVNLPTKQMNEVLEERDNLYDISDVPSPFVLRIYLRISTTNYSIMKSIPIERDGDKYVFRLDSLEDWNNKKYSAAKPVEYYLTARDNILPNNKLIKETTNSIVSSSDNNYDKAFKIFQWAISNTKYSQNFSLNPDDMLKEKKASGIGLSNLVVSMLNSQDIPARVVVGQERINDGDLTYDKLYTNHRWVEFYYDNRWVVMDTNYRVEDIKGNYISNFDISKDYMNILYKITEFK